MSVLGIKCEEFLLLAYCSFLDQEPATSLVQPAWGCIISEPELRSTLTMERGQNSAYYVEALRLDLHSRVQLLFSAQDSTSRSTSTSSSLLAGLIFYSKHPMLCQ